MAPKGVTPCITEFAASAFSAASAFLAGVTEEVARRGGSWWTPSESSRTLEQIFTCSLGNRSGDTYMCIAAMTPGITLLSHVVNCNALSTRRARPCAFHYTAERPSHTHPLTPTPLHQQWARVEGSPAEAGWDGSLADSRPSVCQNASPTTRGLGRSGALPARAMTACWA